MKKLLYVTKDQLIQINDESIRRNFNRTLIRDFLERLPDDLKFPVDCIRIGERGAYLRCTVFIATNADATDGALYYLDMTNEAFDSLPDIGPKTHEGVEVTSELLRFITDALRMAEVETLADLRHALECSDAVDREKEDRLWYEIDALCMEFGEDCAGPFCPMEESEAKG